MLPVVVPLAAVVLALLLWHLAARRLLTLPRAAVAVGLCVYAGGVVAHTVFPIYLDKPTGDAPWGAFVDVTPFVGYEVADAVMNIGVFLPLGILWALVWPAAGGVRVLAAAAVTSLGIEASQYVTAHFLGGGHVADVDDFLSNVAGAALGLVLLRSAARVAVLERLVDPFRWTSAPGRAVRDAERVRA